MHAAPLYFSAIAVATIVVLAAVIAPLPHCGLVERARADRAPRLRAGERDRHRARQSVRDQSSFPRLGCHAWTMRRTACRRCTGPSSSCRSCSIRPRRRTTRSIISRRSSSPIATTRFASHCSRDFADAADETLPGDAAIVDACDGRRSRAEWRVRRRIAVLPLPAPATEKRSRGRVDGLGAKTRKARGVQRVSRGKGSSCVLPHRGRHVVAVGRAIRDHARRRHPPAARRGRIAHRHARTSAQSRRFRRRRHTSGRRLRHSAAARERDARECESIALRVDLRRPSRRRSVHDGRLRRLSGLVRRRVIHRKGHLRRRGVRAGDRRPLSGECASEPRSHRRRVRSLRDS